MIDDSFIRNLGLVVIAAAILAVLCKMLRLPALAGYLAAGLALGPATGLLEVSEPLKLISETGIVLMLFLVGLELSLQKIRDVGRIAVVIGVLQVVVTGAAAWGLARLLGMALLPSLFVAAGLTLSSTVVVVKLLDEKRQSATPHGRIAIGVLLIQDMVVIVLLTVLNALSGQDSLEIGVVAGAVGRAIAGMTVLLIAVAVLSRYVLWRPFAWAARSLDALFVWSLCWCFLVLLGAHALHLSHEMGAFLAGIALAQFPHTRDLHRRVHPLMNFFIAIFFVSLGVQMDIGAALSQWKAVLALCAFAILGKLAIMLAIGRWARLPRATSLLTAVSLAQISEFSFILAALGADSGLVGRDVFSLLAAVGLVSIAVSASMIHYDRQILLFAERAGLLRWMGTAVAADEEASGDEWADHIIVVGMNTLGRDLVCRLSAAGETTIAIDTDIQKLRDLPGATLLGSAEYLPVLEEAGLHRAKLLVSALHIEEANDLLAYRCRSAGVRCAIHGIDLSVVDNLMDMDVAYLMIPKIDGVKLQMRKLAELGFVKK